jgi:hypothetical protein
MEKSRYFKNISVSRKNAFIFTLILVITLSCYGLVFYSSNNKKSSALLVDISGKNRMLSQRIAAMAQLVSCSDDDSIYNKARQELLKAVEAHDVSLKVLKEGGFLPNANLEKPLSVASPLIAEKISETQKYFEGHKNLVNVLLNKPKYIINDKDSVSEKKLTASFIEATKTLQKRFVSGTLLKHNIEITKMFVEQAERQQDNFTILLILLVFLNLLCIAIGFWLLQKYISTPLKKLSVISDKISKGETNIISEYNSEDDIGKISDSINVLTGNLRKAADFTNKIGQGDFTAELDTVVTETSNKEQNLAASLLTMKKRLSEVAEDDKKRNWTSEGLAKFADFFRFNYEINSFGDIVLKHLVEYLKANQGGLFILNENNPEHSYLELISCYAYERKKYEKKNIEIGEGLVGQAYQEKETIFITEVPKDYITITSGLGGASPKCIIIVPIKNNDSVEGILELASFNVFMEHEIVFIEKLAENIASALSNLKTTTKTKKLLQESQIQEEQLRSQEEEMRQNMEELSATQEQMVSKEREYLHIIEKLKASLSKYEEMV